jgi:hypothetical protein
VFPVRYEHNLHTKSRAIPVTSCEGLLGCEMLRIPYCLDNELIDGSDIVRLTNRPLSTPQKYFSFLSLVLISVRG